MEFPHLSDTKFPNLSNVNVYSYKNEFDYTRWIENTKVHLTNVLWNSDYNDVVKFETNEARDEWFDSHEGDFEIKLTTKHNLPPEGGIKLPIPFDVATRYNYLVVDIPIMTSPDNPIEYESEMYGVRRWFFFINEVSSRAPNTTMFDISLDVWTQFQNEVDIQYMFLERGHAPVAATNVLEYLANPIENNRYLLTPDITPNNPSVVSSQRYIPFGNGPKYVCIASTCAPTQLGSLGTVVHNSGDYTFGNITYSDTSARWGYQLQVNGFGAGNGDDYSALRTPTSPVNPNGVIANNTFVYAIPSTDVYGSGTFFNDIMNTCPTLMQTILGCFIVDSNMITLGQAYTVAGHTVYACTGSQRDINIAKLDLDDFDYPEQYQRFAKLYTYPYASIELTDNEGKTVTVRVENTGNISAHLISELAFPYVNMRMFFDGINGSGSTQYAWVNLDGTSTSLDMPDSDWFDFCFDHKIPCFALYMDGETAWYLDNFNDRLKGGRYNALVAYHNAARPANNARENVVDSDTCMYNNTDADATTYTTNTKNSVDTNRANIDISIANNVEKTNFSNVTSTLVTQENNEKGRLETNAANLASVITTVQQNEVTTATNRNSGFGALAGGAATALAGAALYGATAGATVGTAAGPAGTAAGGIAGMAAGAAISAGIGIGSVASSFAANSFTASTVTQANSVTVQANAQANASSLTAGQNAAVGIVTLLNGERTYNMDHDNDTLDRHTTNTGNNMNTNAANTAATMRGNSARLRAYNDANALYTREVGILNAKETLENAHRNLQYAYDGSHMKPARPIGSYAGDPTADYMKTRGVQMKVRKMPLAEVHAVGDWFARYGYALNQVWPLELTGLCPMNHFCYWKTRDIWVDDRNSSNNAAQDIFTTIFNRGVTVWKDPDEVGRVSIYDN